MIADINTAVTNKLAAAMANPTGGKATGTGGVKAPVSLPIMSPPINQMISTTGTQQMLGLQPLPQATASGAPTPPTIAK